MAQILVIDDDEIMRDVVVQMLTEAGYSVQSAEDGRKGLRIFYDGAFDLVVTDLIMPEKEGLEVIQELRAHSHSIPIIAISGGGRMSPDGYLKMAQAFGVDYTFTKPFMIESFLAAVRECVAGIK